MKNLEALTFTYGELLIMQERFVKAAESGVKFTVDEIKLLSRVEAKLMEFKFMEAADEYVKKLINDDLPIFQVPRVTLLRLYKEYNTVKARRISPLFSWEDFFEEALGDNPFKEGKETVLNMIEVLEKKRARKEEEEEKKREEKSDE
ncbi:hypothetical protein [Bacillus phage phiAGATE]|uniref:Uncharacterized protein n=1 Tax=Bacillus phage phiAGATE TaxID=1204533 RepID=L0L8G3_9CAUD|nr:hypothetical protein G380_gp054 [Bacillus phage phiAGATE]AGB62704.1 hypothetical protein [Bacillus phage phiAGATE]